MQRPGGPGEKVVLPDAKFLVDAEGLDPPYAGILACCGLTAYAALGKIIRREGAIGIIGMGGLGLMALAIAKGTGFGRVAAVDTIESLNRRAVIAGHKKSEKDDSPRIIEETRQYIRDFDRVAETATTARELYDKMLELYPARANPGPLWGSARGVKGAS